MQEKNPFMVTFSQQLVAYIKRDEQSRLIQSALLGNPRFFSSGRKIRPEPLKKAPLRCLRMLKY